MSKKHTIENISEDNVFKGINDQRMWEIFEKEGGWQKEYLRLEDCYDDILRKLAFPDVKKKVMDNTMNFLMNLNKEKRYFLWKEDASTLLIWILSIESIERTIDIITLKISHDKRSEISRKMYKKLLVDYNNELKSRITKIEDELI